MGAGHSHGATRNDQNQRRLTLVLVLAAIYMVVEVIGGLLSNSLALLADAGHMLSDVAALALSLFAIWIAKRPAPTSRTYGYYRTEILAALHWELMGVAREVSRAAPPRWPGFGWPPDTHRAGGFHTGMCSQPV